MNKTIAIVQARMSSSRYPGKVLEQLGGLPSIVFMVRRAERAKTLNQVVVATSTDSSDDRLVATLRDHAIECFRGDLQDVLARFASAANHFGATEVVRLTGDCPLIDPAVVDAVVSARQETNADYASNIEPATYPDGLDVECFTRQLLERAVVEAKTIAQREHVTVWMRDPKSNLVRHNVCGLVDGSALRLTVDYPDDLCAVRRLVEAIGEGLEFDYFDMLRALSANPQILSMNPHARNEGLAKSLSANE